MDRITIHIATKDRWAELGLLLQSLRAQTFQDFDIIIYDQSQPNPIFSSYFLMSLINRMKLENHCFKISHGQPLGVCQARNKCIEIDDFDNPYTFRCDDDVVLEVDYIEKLIKVIKQGYDMASGVVPLIMRPEIIREVNLVLPMINEHKLDDKGNLATMKDECGYCYDEEKIIPTPHFRTNCLYKSNKDLKYPTYLSSVGFREEGFFSFKAIIDFNYKIGVNTKAVAWHMQSPSGGVRTPNYPQLVQSDHKAWVDWIKEKFESHGDFLTKYKMEILK
jgi:hypothetical protein